MLLFAVVVGKSNRVTCQVFSHIEEVNDEGVYRVLRSFFRFILASSLFLFFSLFNVLNVPSPSRQDEINVSIIIILLLESIGWKRSSFFFHSFVQRVLRIKNNIFPCNQITLLLIHFDFIKISLTE
jgi:hypothetical protein